MPDDHERRITTLEVNQLHMKDTVETMAGKVDELHSLMFQAKGARWAILAVVAFASFFAGKIGTLTGIFHVTK